MANFKVFALALFAAHVHISTASVECPPREENLLVPHPDCTKYVVCTWGVPIERPCPPNLYFNPRVDVCDHRVNVPECEDGTRAPIDEPTTTTEPTTTAEPEIVLNSCGDTYTGNSGVIRYKVNEAYAKDEICSFVVRTLDHGGFVFNLRSEGIDASKDPNAINIFTYGTNGQIDSAHMGPPNPLTSAYLSGGIAVVIFRTKGNNGTGFELSFEGVGKTAYANGVQMVYGDRSGGSITVPSWGNFSGTTNVIVLTADHKQVDSSDPFATLKLTFSNEDLYRCGKCGCGDYLYVYSFRQDNTYMEEYFCDELSNKSIFSTNGVLIIVFRKFYDGNWGKVTLTWQVNSLFNRQ